MNWPIVVEIVAAVLPGPLAIGAVAWLSKIVITSRFEKEADKFKSTLEAGATQHKHTLEQQSTAFQHQLAQSGMVHRVRFESLHAKRAEKIEELYQDACLSTWKLFEFVHLVQESGEEHQAECGRQAVKMANEFKRKALLARIYFRPELSRMLAKFATDLFAHSRQWHFEYEMAKRDNRNPYFNDRGGMSEFGQAHKKLESDFLAVTEQLEREFRVLLGVGASDELLVASVATGQAD